MTRQTYAGTIFIVEGDGDEKLFRKFAQDPEAPIIPAWGKENVLDAAEILDREAAGDGFLAIVDADSWYLDGRFPSSPNVLFTDEHDLEMMIVRSNSFASVVRELGSQPKIFKFTRSSGSTVSDSLTILRDILLRKAICLGCLRWWSISDHLELKFEGLSFERFIDRDSLDVDIEVLVGNTLALTKISRLRTTDIVPKLKEMIETSNDDPYKVCCGHDFIAILGLGLRKALGNKSKEAAAPENIETAFRLSYDISSFMATRLYSRAKQWEQHNPPFMTFP
jgi:hypothetical protein